MGEKFAFHFSAIIVDGYYNVCVIPIDRAVYFYSPHKQQTLWYVVCVVVYHRRQHKAIELKVLYD